MEYVSIRSTHSLRKGKIKFRKKRAVFPETLGHLDRIQVFLNLLGRHLLFLRLLYFYIEMNNFVHYILILLTSFDFTYRNTHQKFYMDGKVENNHPQTYLIFLYIFKHFGA